MKKLSLLLAVAFLIFAACEKEEVTPDPDPKPDETEEKWEIELVDSVAGMELGTYNVLAYDADSGIHIAYVAQVAAAMSLKYAYKPYNGAWTITDVASSLQHFIIDLAVDNQKNIFIAYESKNDDKLYIAEKSINGQFNHVLIDLLGPYDNHQAQYPALYADEYQNIHISFHRANYGMRYSSYSFQGTFSPVETIDSDVLGSSSDIVVDKQGNKHVLHFKGADKYYSYYNVSDNKWTVSKIATGANSQQSWESISLAIDQFDNLHGSYRYETTTVDNNIHYLFKANGSNTWTEEGIGNVGGSSKNDRAIACDTLGNPHVLYDENFELKIASKNASWTYGEIMGNASYRCKDYYDIEITNKNRAHVSFNCITTGVLRYATKKLK